MDAEKILTLHINKDVSDLVLKFTFEDESTKEYIKLGFNEEISKLLEQIEKMETFPTLFNNLLKYACHYCNFPIAKLLIEKYGANNWQTSLQEACGYGWGGYDPYEVNLDIIKLLVENGREFINLNKVINCACSHGSLPVLEYIIQNGGDIKIVGLSDSIHNNKLDIVEYLVNKKIGNCNKGLSTACFSGNYDMVELLINKIDKNKNYTNTEYQTVNFDNYYGDKLLNDACYSGNLNIIKLLVKNKLGNKTEGLKQAIQYCHFEIIKFLNDSIVKEKTLKKKLKKKRNRRNKK